jgi:hypothetical protein
VGSSVLGDSLARSRAAGGVRAERWKFFTLAIVCHEGRPPADDIFSHAGCRPQPVPR